MTDPSVPRLAREMSLLTLAATGICSMLGAAINIIPFMLQRNVPGIGPNVLVAYALGAIPAVLAALAYAHLASAMPRAGGSYVYASRALNPYLGFVASFSQWFGLCVAIGVVSFVVVPFFRDIAAAVNLPNLAEMMDRPLVRLTIALAFLWTFVGINLRGLKSYARTLIPLMVIMFVLGGVVIATGLLFSQNDFAAGLQAAEGLTLVPVAAPPLTMTALLSAAAILFSSFIGFDSIAQAGGEARNPHRNMPLAIGIAVVSVGTFYILFTWSVYRIVPWYFIAERAATQDLTAPGLLGYVLPTGWTVAIVGGAAIALINDLPAMLLAVSRLVFAWAEDGVFPKSMAAVNERWRTPHVALVVSALMASASIVGSHLAGDFFLGVDILATALLLNFLIMCLSVLTLPYRNPGIAARVVFLPRRGPQIVVGLTGVIVLSVFLAAHILKDVNAEVQAWYFHTTVMFGAVMAVASGIFFWHWRRLKASGVDVERMFRDLPAE